MSTPRRVRRSGAKSGAESERLPPLRPRSGPPTNQISSSLRPNKSLPAAQEHNWEDDSLSIFYCFSLSCSAIAQLAADINPPINCGPKSPSPSSLASILQTKALKRLWATTSNPHHESALGARAESRFTQNLS